MAQFSVNTHRFDPYKNFKFRLKWDGEYVAGVSKVSALKRTTEVIEYRYGGDNSTVYKAPGQHKFEPITLEEGITHSEEFEQWAKLVWSINAGAGAEVSLANFRKNITLELMNESGQIVAAFNIYRCWVSEYQAMPELDSSGNAVALRMIKLENEGFERDTAVVEPTEPTLDVSG